MSKKKSPLTAAEKRSKGYHFIQDVNGVPVFLAKKTSDMSLDIDSGPARVAFLAKQCAKAVEREIKSQASSAESNGSIIFTEYNGRLRVVASGTRQWVLMSKTKGLEMFSPENVKLARAFLATLPDVTSVEVSAEDDE